VLPFLSCAGEVREAGSFFVSLPQEKQGRGRKPFSRQSPLLKGYAGRKKVKKSA